jgi:transcriptional regulator with XRE-family HTH domain
MLIGDRLRAIRESKGLSQTELRKRTGLLSCYISRVENGHTIPSIQTLEKFARALEIPIYQLFYDGQEPSALSELSMRPMTGKEILWGASGKDSHYLMRVRSHLAMMDEDHRKILLLVAQRLARHRTRRSGPVASV